MIPLLLLIPLTCTWAAEICCPNLGCFSDTGAFAGLPLPECQSSQGITHTLYTRSNRNNGELVTRTNVPNEWSGTKETVFLIHGWNSNHDSSWMHNAKNAILEQDDKNVIIVGWGTGAGRTYYPQSASNTRVVGAETRDIKEALQDSHGSNINTYCVGHSLGAHTCGHMGQFGSDRGVNRISAFVSEAGRVGSGLDPAGPWFQNADLRRGLNINCADQVEAWHTDGKDSINSYGTLRPMGHRDFYPNGGGVQPGCLSYKLGFRDELLHPELKNDPLIACSHSRAHKYFIESVQNDCFNVNQICSDENDLPGSCSSCSNCPSMGYVNRSGQNGKYYFEVNRFSPHCQG